MPIKIILYCMSDIYNCKASYQGVVHSSKIFTESYVVMVLIGTVRGSGQGFTKVLERLIRGTWSLNVHEFMNPSFTTKMSALASIIFIANRHSEWLMITQPFVFFCVACATIYFRLSSLLLDINNPFSPFENIFCQLFFGGIWDAIAKAIIIDEQSRYNQLTGNVRVRAMKADLLSRTNRIIADKTSGQTNDV